MSEGITKQDLNNLREATITANTKDIISHFNQSQGYRNERLEVIDVKLDALMRESAVRKKLRNLVGGLHDKGISVDSSKIFLSTFSSNKKRSR